MTPPHPARYRESPKMSEGDLRRCMTRSRGVTDALTLRQLIEKQKRKDIPTIDWLDKLAYRQIERIHAVHRTYQCPAARAD